MSRRARRALKGPMLSGVGAAKGGRGFGSVFLKHCRNQASLWIASAGPIWGALLQVDFQLDFRLCSSSCLFARLDFKLARALALPFPRRSFRISSFPEPGRGRDGRDVPCGPHDRRLRRRVVCRVGPASGRAVSIGSA